MGETQMTAKKRQYLQALMKEVQVYFKDYRPCLPSIVSKNQTVLVPRRCMAKNNHLSWTIEVDLKKALLCQLGFHYALTHCNWCSLKVCEVG